MSDSPIAGTIDPDDAFGALADATRVAILQALWDAEGHEATFSTLRDAVGVDDSGRFNYHLDRLTDRFVVRTDDGYRLTLAGRNVHGALLAGAYTQEGSVDPIPLPEPCPACGGDRTFRYDGEQVEIVCADCDVRSHFSVPPGVFEGYEVGAWPAVADRYVRTIIAEVDNGFCPFCEGRIRTRVAPRLGKMDADPGADPAPDADLPERHRGVPSIRYECERCGEEVVVDLGSGLSTHPAVVAFFHDQGIDLRDVPLARLSATGHDRARVRKRDPLRASVRYAAGGETLTLVVDADCTVRSVDRSDG